MKKKKKTKIKWINVSLLILLIFCAYIVGHDILVILIYPWFGGQAVGWTHFGFFTFLAALFTGGAIVDYFIDEFNDN